MRPLSQPGKRWLDRSRLAPLFRVVLEADAPNSIVAIALRAHAVDLPLDHGALVSLQAPSLRVGKAARRPQVEGSQGNDDQEHAEKGSPVGRIEMGKSALLRGEGRPGGRPLGWSRISLGIELVRQMLRGA